MTGGPMVCERGGCGSPDAGVAGWRKLPKVSVRATSPMAQAAARARNTSGQYPFAVRRLQLRTTKAASRRPSSKRQLCRTDALGRNRELSRHAAVGMERNVALVVVGTGGEPDGPRLRLAGTDDRAGLDALDVEV